MAVSVPRIARELVDARLRPAADPERLSHRVWPRYLDVNLHMNQAVYAEVLELGRVRWVVRNHLLLPWLRARLSPVIVQLHLTFRRELRPLQAFEVLTRLVETRRKVGIFQQLFVRGQRVHAEAEARYALLEKGRPIDLASVHAGGKAAVRRPFLLQRSAGSVLVVPERDGSAPDDGTSAPL